MCENTLALSGHADDAQMHTCMMVVSPSLAKRTHLRKPIAAAFLRSNGVIRGLGVVVMSVPVCMFRLS